MSAKRDYYDVLGVSRNADEAQIKKAYRSLPKSITRIQMQGMRRQSRSLKK